MKYPKLYAQTGLNNEYDRRRIATAAMEGRWSDLSSDDMVQYKKNRGNVARVNTDYDESDPNSVAYEGWLNTDPVYAKGINTGKQLGRDIGKAGMTAAATAVVAPLAGVAAAKAAPILFPYALRTLGAYTKGVDKAASIATKIPGIKQVVSNPYVQRLISNEYAQGAATGLGMYEAMTETAPAARQAFEEGRYLDAAGNTALVGAEMTPFYYLGSKAMLKSPGYLKTAKDVLTDKNKRDYIFGSKEVKNIENKLREKGYRIPAYVKHSTETTFEKLNNAIKKQNYNYLIDNKITKPRLEIGWLDKNRVPKPVFYENPYPPIFERLKMFNDKTKNKLNVSFRIDDKGTKKHKLAIESDKGEITAVNKGDYWGSIEAFNENPIDAGRQYNELIELLDKGEKIKEMNLSGDSFYNILRQSKGKKFDVSWDGSMAVLNNAGKYSPISKAMNPVRKAVDDHYVGAGANKPNLELQSMLNNLNRATEDLLNQYISDYGLPGKASKGKIPAYTLTKK